MAGSYARFSTRNYSDGEMEPEARANLAYVCPLVVTKLDLSTFGCIRNAEESCVCGTG